MVTHIDLGDAEAAVNSVLLSDYDYLREITGASDLTPVAVAGDAYGVLFRSASGTGSFVVPSSAGWEQESLPKRLSPGLLVGLPWGSGQVIAVGTGPNVASPDLWSSVRAAAGHWSDWAPVDVGPELPPESCVTGLAVTRAAGAAEIVVTLDDGSGWCLDPEPGAEKWKLIGPVSVGLLAGAVVAGRPGLVTVTRNAQDPSRYDLVFYARPYRDAAQVLASAVSVTALTAAEQAAGDSLVFLADKGYLSGTRRVWTLDGTDPAAGLHVIDDGHTLVSEIAAMAATATSPVTLFATAADNGHLHTWTPGRSKPEQGLFDLGVPLSSLSVASSAGGRAELAGVDAGARRLLRVWRAPDQEEEVAGGLGAWQVDEIDLPAGPLTQRYAHSTVFTLTDSNGIPLAQTPVSVYADGLVSLEAGGVVGQAGPESPLATATDAAGRVRVVVPTQAFSTRKLCLVTGSALTAPGDAIHWFAPNELVMRRLGALSAEELAPLIPDTHIRDAAHTVLTTIATAHYTDFQPGTTARSGAPVLFTADASGARARALAPGELRQALAVSRTDLSVGGLLDFIQDAFEAAANAVESAVTYVIDGAEKGINMLVTLVIDGVTWSASALLTTLEEGIAAVELVLDAVKVTFDRIVSFFGWLLSDAKAAIWQTKEYIERLLTEGLTMLADLADRASAGSSDFFADQERWVKENFQALLADVGKEQMEPPEPPRPDAAGGPIQAAMDDVGSAASWLFDKVADAGGGFAVGMTVPDAVIGEITASIGEIGNDISGDVQASVDEFLQKLKDLATSRKGIAELALGTLLGLAEEVILAVLRSADTISQKALELVARTLRQLVTSVLQAPVGDGLAQDLADLVNPGAPQSLTVAGFAALVAAAPATVLYKAVFDDVPFPDGPAASDSNIDIATRARQVSGAIMIFWSIIDGLLDVMANPPKPSPPQPGPAKPPSSRALNLVLCLYPLTAQMLMWPGGPLSRPVIGTDEELLTWVAWGTGLGAPGFNLLFTVSQRFNSTARAGGASTLGLAFFAVIALGMNITRNARGGKGIQAYDWVNGIAAPLPNTCKFLGWVQPGGRFALAAIDLVSGSAAGTARILRKP